MNTCLVLKKVIIAGNSLTNENGRLMAILERAGFR